MALFSKKQRLESSGHAGDDKLLSIISSRSDLSAPRHWVHYLYFPGEAPARAAAEDAQAAGWNLQRVDEAATQDGSWVVIAERHEVVVDPTSVREARETFESIASRYPGGDYDGWEASL